MPRWVEKPSSHSVTESLDRLESALTTQGFTVMARVDHSGHAGNAGLQLRPTQVLLFGKPALGTQLMAVEQVLAIDLPSKVLAWRDAGGQVRLGYRDLRTLLVDHAGLQRVSAVVEELADAIDAATDFAVAQP